MNDSWRLGFTFQVCFILSNSLSHISYLNQVTCFYHLSSICLNSWEKCRVIMQCKKLKVSNWCKKFPKMPKCFSNIGIFPECKILEKTNPTFYSLPKTLRYHKNSKTPKKNFKHPGETFPKELYPKWSMFWAAWKKKPYVSLQAAQTFCMIWKAHQCQWFNNDG